MRSVQFATLMIVALLLGTGTAMTQSVKPCPWKSTTCPNLSMGSNEDMELAGARCDTLLTDKTWYHVGGPVEMGYLCCDGTDSTCDGSEYQGKAKRTHPITVTKYQCRRQDQGPMEGTLCFVRKNNGEPSYPPEVQCCN